MVSVKGRRLLISEVVKTPTIIAFWFCVWKWWIARVDADQSQYMGRSKMFGPHTRRDYIPWGSATPEMIAGHYKPWLEKTYFKHHDGVRQWDL